MRAAWTYRSQRRYLTSQLIPLQDKQSADLESLRAEFGKPINHLNESIYLVSDVLKASLNAIDNLAAVGWGQGLLEIHYVCRKNIVGIIWLI